MMFKRGWFYCSLIKKESEMMETLEHKLDKIFINATIKNMDVARKIMGIKEINPTTWAIL